MADQLLQSLPMPFREDAATRDFLQAFEKVLLGSADAVTIGPESFLGIEEEIARLPTYFDSANTPESFLPWLAGWLALSLRADLDKAKHRAFIAQLPDVYKWRGTPQSLIALLRTFTNRDATVTPVPDKPLCFVVTIDFSDLIVGKAPSEVIRLRAIAADLIDRERPAHTCYELMPIFPSFRLGGTLPDGTETFFAQLGGVDAAGKLIGDTLLGVAQWDK